MLPGERFERGDDCYAVESRRDDGTITIALVHHRRARAGHWRHQWQPEATLASHSFGQRDLTGYWAYAAKLSEAARFALDGELGCYVDVQSSRDGFVRLRLSERRIRQLELVTRVLEEHQVDAAGDDAVVPSAELAEALRQRAHELNEAASEGELLAQIERARAAETLGDQEREAEELARILREDPPPSG